MGLTVTGIIESEAILLNLDNTAKRRGVSKMIEKAKEIQALAIKMAPVDEGNLEQAIKVRGEERARDDLGRFARREVEVYIDLDMEVPQRPGKTVGDYAYEMHEHLAPTGSDYQLGEKSQEKQAGSDVVVGGGFMTRALEQLRESVLRDVEIAIKSAL